MAEGQLGVLSLDLAGNLRTTGSSGSAGPGGGLSDAELRASAVTVAFGGISSVSHVGTLPVSLATTALVGISAVSVVGAVPVTLSSTSLTGTSAVSVVGTSVNSLVGVSAVSHVGTQPVSLAATSNVSVIGTVPVTLSSTSLTGVSAVSVVGALAVTLSSTSLTGVSAVSVVGTSIVSGPLTDAQLRATPVPGDLRRGQTILFAPIDVATSGDNTIVAADGTKKIKTLSYTLVADAAVTARWKSGAGTSLSGAMSLAASGGIASPVATPAGGHLFETAAATALVLNLSGAIGARGHLSYFLEL